MDNFVTLTVTVPSSPARHPLALASLMGNSMVAAARRLLGRLPALIDADDGHPHTFDPWGCFGLRRPLTSDQTATLRWE